MCFDDELLWYTKGTKGTSDSMDTIVSVIVYASICLQFEVVCISILNKTCNTMTVTTVNTSMVFDNFSYVGMLYATTCRKIRQSIHATVMLYITIVSWVSVLHCFE